MRKVMLMLAGVVACTMMTCHAFAGDKPFDFRNVRWGMTPDEVKHSENNNPVYENKDTNIISYSDSLFSKKVRLTYMFDEANHLYTASYSLDEEANSNFTEEDFKTYYHKLVESLTEKYGEHKPGKIYVSNTKEALEWNSGDTQITIRLNSFNGKTTVTIGYNSKKLKNKQDEKIKQKNKAKL